MGNNEMEENELDRQIKSIRRKGMYKDDVMNLVERDLRFGLTREQTLEYCEGTKYNIKQMQIYSNLLHRNVSDDVKEFICNPGLNSSQMQVLYDYYIKGVPLDKLREGLEKDSIPKHMSELFQRMLKQIEKQKPVADETTESTDLIRDGDNVQLEDGATGSVEPDISENAQINEADSNEDEQKNTSESSDVKDSDPTVISPELIALLERMDTRMEKQDKFYEQMSGTLDKLNQQKEDDDVTKSLLEKYNSQEALIINQQEQLNEANRALARLRAEKETAEKELQKLKNKQMTVEQQSRDSSKERDASESVEVNMPSKEEGGQANMGFAQTAFESQPIPPMQKGTIPVYYQVPFTEGGKVIGQVEVERSARRTVGGVGIFAKLFLKKKSRIDLVSRLAAGDMLPDQLVQIRVAIEKGLYEEQLVELINHNVPVEKMKEIIEIAVLENSMA